MTQKIGSLSRWSALDNGSAIRFESDLPGERRIRLHLNLEAVTTFYLATGGKPILLATAGPGLETLEFSAAGNLEIIPEKDHGAIRYHTAESEPTFAKILDPVIFTRIANRRHRNPEMEEMMWRMQANMERRLAQTAGEIEAAFERRRKEEQNGRPVEIVQTDAPGAAANDGGGDEPEPKPADKKPGKAAESKDEGKGKGGKPDEA